MLKRIKMSAALVAASALLVSGCGATADRPEPGSSEPAASGPITGLRFMVPNTAGSGYDTTARAVAKVMDDNEVTRTSRCSTSPERAARSAWPGRCRKRATASC